MYLEFSPQGVCTKQMNIEVDDGKIVNVEFFGGCSGNLQGISALIKGMSAEDAIHKLKGIRCGFKNTSCPDQLAIALQKMLDSEI